MENNNNISDEVLKALSEEQLVELVSRAAKELGCRIGISEQPTKRQLPPPEQCPIEKLDICRRACIGLKRLGFNTVADVMKTTQDEIIARSPKFGRAALNGVAVELKEHYNFDFK